MSLKNMPMERVWNTLLNTTDRMLARERVSARPLTVHIEVNDFCNLKCPHCPREDPTSQINTGHISMEAIRNLEPWLRRANWVGLTGNGEPFLHPNMMEIIDFVIECGGVPSTISNATLWKRLGVVEKLAGKGPMIINVSVDGGTKETFEKWRVNAKWEEVRANLAELHAAKKAKGASYPLLNFVTCLMRDNIAEVEEIVDWGHEVGVSCVQFQNMYPYNKSLESERVTDFNECRRAIGKARERAARYGMRVDYFPLYTDIEERNGEGGSYGAISSNAVDRNLKSGNGHKAEKAEKKSYYCDNLWNRVHVALNGDVRYCCYWQDGPAGNLATDDLADLWNGEGWRGLRRDLTNGIKHKSCTNCHNLVERDRKRIFQEAVAELKSLKDR